MGLAYHATLSTPERAPLASSAVISQFQAGRVRDQVFFFFGGAVAHDSQFLVHRRQFQKCHVRLFRLRDSGMA